MFIDTNRARRRLRDCDERQGEQQLSRNFVGIEMPVEECLVFGVGLISVNAKRVLIEDGAQQIEARILVPTSTLVKIRVRKYQDAEQKQILEAQAPIRGLRIFDRGLLPKFSLHVQSRDYS